MNNYCDINCNHEEGFSDLTFDNFDRNIKNYYGKGLYGISYEKDFLHIDSDCGPRLLQP